MVARMKAITIMAGVPGGVLHFQILEVTTHAEDHVIYMTAGTRVWDAEISKTKRTGLGAQTTIDMEIRGDMVKVNLTEAAMAVIRQA